MSTALQLSRQQKQSMQSMSFQINITQSIYQPTSPDLPNLSKKYSSQFNFFLSKPINNLIYNISNQPLNLAFNDILADRPKEYFRRRYVWVNQYGKQEMLDKIQMLIDYYCQDNKRWLQWQYPMMILTQTKQIFLRRRKRLIKLDFSLDQFDDQTNKNSTELFVSCRTDEFLKDLSKLSDFYDQSFSISIKKSFDQDIHDIYNINDDNFQLTIKNYVDLQKIQNSENECTQFNQIDYLIWDLSKFQIRINPFKQIIENEEINTFNLNVVNPFNKPFAQRLKQLTQNIKKQKFNDYQSVYTYQRVSNMKNQKYINRSKQRQYNLKSRKKIRQKAEQLFEKIEQQKKALLLNEIKIRKQIQIIFLN